jgi:hypothetical protein
LKIELLYFEGCPGHEPALNALKDVLKEEEVGASVKSINVNSDDLVINHRFLGSPSIRIDGMDIEIESRSINDFGQKCRIYDNNGVPSGIPPKNMIRQAIREAKDNHSCCG